MPREVDVGMRREHGSSSSSSRTILRPGDGKFPSNLAQRISPVRLDRASLPYYTQLVRLVSESESARDAQIKKSP